MAKIRSLGVFCGSAGADNAEIVKFAHSLGEQLAARKIRLVYGAGSTGIMGVIADACLENGGEVCGYIPEALAKPEWMHDGLTERYIVPDMHERKKLMYQNSDAFLSLPGGIGTLDEFFESWTWSQLWMHQGSPQKPVALANIDSYYDDLISFLSSMLNKNFLQNKHLELLSVIEKPTHLEEFLDKTRG